MPPELLGLLRELLQRAADRSYVDSVDGHGVTSYLGAAQPDKLGLVGLAQRHRVVAGEAGRAVALARRRRADRRHEAVVREVRERVARDVARDLVDGVRRRDQLAARRRVDAVVAGVRRR